MLPDYVRPIFTFGYCTGMRLGELQKLTWRHIDLKDGMIRLESEDTKNDEARAIPYRQVPELAGIVDQLWRQATDKSGLVFTRAKGRPLGSFARRGFAPASNRSWDGCFGNVRPAIEKQRSRSRSGRPRDPKRSRRCVHAA